MALPKDVGLQMVAGDAYSHIFDYVDEDGNPIDLTGETITHKFYAGRDLILTLEAGSGLTITAATGRIQMDLIDTETEQLDGLRDRKHVLRLDTSDTTLAVGVVEVYNNV